MSLFEGRRWLFIGIAIIILIPVIYAINYHENFVSSTNATFIEELQIGDKDAVSTLMTEYVAKNKSVDNLDTDPIYFLSVMLEGLYTYDELTQMYFDSDYDNVGEWYSANISHWEDELNGYSN